VVADLVSVDRHYVEPVGGVGRADGLKVGLCCPFPAGCFRSGDALLRESAVAPFFDLDEHDHPFIERY